MRVNLAYLVIPMAKRMIKSILIILIWMSFLYGEVNPAPPSSSGRIIYFTADQVYCDLGLNQYLKVGDTLDVTRRAELIGTLLVTNISNKSSVCDILTPEVHYKLGDLVTSRRPLIPMEIDSSSTRLSPKDSEIIRPFRKKFGQHGTGSIRSNYNQITEEFRWYESIQYNASYRSLRFWVFGRSNSTQNKFSLYQAKADYGSKHSGKYIQIGRVFSSEFSGMGATDGFMAQWSKKNKFTTGGLLGTQPEPNTFKPDFNVKKIGFFTSFNHSKSTLNLKGTLSFVGQYKSNLVDREFAYLKLNGQVKEKVTFRLNGIFDYYRTSLGKRTGFNRTSTQGSIFYKINKSTSFQILF